MISSSRKKIGYLFIFIALILLIVIIFLFLMPQNNPFKNLFKKTDTGLEVKTPEQEFNEMNLQKERETIYVYDEELEKNRDWSEDDFKQLARSFAERFGSYSNQSDYGNIEDLRIFMTTKMKDWADNYVVELRNSRQYSGEFYGIVSKALTEPEVYDFDPSSNKVEVMVSVQREENSDSSEGKVFTQKLKVVFVKENNQWLVDEAFWQ